MREKDEIEEPARQDMKLETPSYKSTIQKSFTIQRIRIRKHSL